MAVRPLALMLCYTFPPLSGGGVLRSAKFAKYLSESRWNLHVITAKVNPRNRIEQGLDYSLLEDLPPEVTVHRTSSFDLSWTYAAAYRLGIRKLLFELESLIPLLHMDYKMGWYASATRAVARARATRSNQPIVLYTTSPPYVAHLIGRTCARRFGLPWVADFRDPWTLRGTYHAVTALHTSIDRALEAAILNNADAVVANTESNRARLLEAFNVAAQKVFVIPNGFDSEDFERVAHVPVRNDRFLVTCTGKFYQTPNSDHFFRAFCRFHERHPEALLCLFGRNSRGIRKTTSAMLAPESWISPERTEHASIVRRMRESAVLLANVPGERAAHSVPGKLYEYLAAGRPVLFVGALNGDAARIVTRTGTGRAVAEDEGEILAALEDLWKAWKTRTSAIQPRMEAIAPYDRRTQTRDLLKVFDFALGRRARLLSASGGAGGP